MSGSGDDVLVSERGSEVLNEVRNRGEGGGALFVWVGHYLILGLTIEAGDGVEYFAVLV